MCNQTEIKTNSKYYMPHQPRQSHVRHTIIATTSLS
jgi:hypothetical protein